MQRYILPRNRSSSLAFDSEMVAVIRGHVQYLEQSKLLTPDEVAKLRERVCPTDNLTPPDARMVFALYQYYDDVSHLKTLLAFTESASEREAREAKRLERYNRKRNSMLRFNKHHGELMDAMQRRASYRIKPMESERVYLERMHATLTDGRLRADKEGEAAAAEGSKRELERQMGGSPEPGSAMSKVPRWMVLFKAHYYKNIDPTASMEAVAQHVLDEQHKENHAASMDKHVWVLRDAILSGTEEALAAALEKVPAAARRAGGLDEIRVAANQLRKLNPGHNFFVAEAEAEALEAALIAAAKEAEETAAQAAKEAKLALEESR